MGKIGDAIRAEATSSGNPSYVTGFQAARYRAAQIADRMEAEAACPHIVTSGTTSHCALAEAEVKRLTQENEDAAWWFPQFIVGTTGNMLGLDWQSEFLDYRKQTTDSAHSAATKFLYGKWAKQAAENARLRAALWFYANVKNYDPVTRLSEEGHTEDGGYVRPESYEAMPIVDDSGARAREALQPKETKHATDH